MRTLCTCDVHSNEPINRNEKTLYVCTQSAREAVRDALSCGPGRGEHVAIRSIFMLLVSSASASRPTCAASRAHKDSVCGFKSFDELLCAVGDLQGESEAEAAQCERFATLGELTRMALTYGGADATPRQHRRNSQCSAVPEPVWSVDGTGKSLRLSDSTSRFALQSPVDVMSAPRADHWMQSEQRRWIHDLLQPGGALRDRWLYFMGDSTMRQDYSYLLNALRRQVRQNRAQETSALSFDRMKAVARGQLSFDEGPNASASMCHSLQQPSDWEYHYPGPIYGINERTTTFRLHDANLTLTFDWKMHVFRRYDRWILARRFARSAPDVLIVSAGLHDCFWNESRALGPEYHKEQVRAYLAFLAAHLPASTALLWVSTQVSIGPLSGGVLPLEQNAVTEGNALRHRSRLFSDGSPSAHLRCVQAVNHAAAAASRDEGWFAYVDRERVTHALASFAVHGHPPIAAVGGVGSLGPLWVPHGSGTTANARASLLTTDGVHYSENNSVLETLNHYLRSALGCVLSSPAGKHRVPAV